MRVAIIPARGGSKRIPRKNIRNFGGQPMIAWSVQIAQQSGLFDHIVVSTDDTEIADTARRFGAEVPFMRPADLSDDYVATRPVIAHAITALQDHYGAAIDYACCIYATAPFLTADSLDQGLRAISERDFLYAFSGCSYPYPVQRGLKISASGGVEMMYPEYRATRSQDLEDVWHDAGQFYWGRAEAWLGDRPIFAPYSTLIDLPRWRVHDIDTEEDWQRAELMFSALRASEKPHT